MRWHEFIFSEKRGVRLLRHFLFWTVWWLFITATFYFQHERWLTIKTPKPFYILLGSNLFLKTFLLVVTYIFACYLFIYLLLPLLKKRKWISFAADSILLCAGLFGLAYLMYWTIFPLVDTLFGSNQQSGYITQFWPAVWLGIIEPFKILAAAAIIKYVKYSWLKQKEKERLEKEKITTELQLLKAQVRPGFLFNALDNIHKYAVISSPRAPELLLKLSDLLSYMLYECDQAFVPLEKEIDRMRDYITIEKLRRNDTIETELSVVGNMSGKMIAPFLLLPFIENSFKQSREMKDQPWMNMDISVEENIFYMKLANSMVAAENTPYLIENGLANVSKRLTLVYPQKHDLKITRESDMLIIVLKIQLGGSAAEEMVKTESLYEPVVS